MVARKRDSQLDYHNRPQVTHPSHIAFKQLPPREPLSERSKVIIADLRVLMKSFVNQRPNKDWAQRVLERHAAGEHIFPLGLEWSREVAQKQIERTPGEDDE